MAKYRKRSVVVEAFRIGIDNIPDWFMDRVTDGKAILRCNAPDNCHIEQRKDYWTWCEVVTLEGVMVGGHGDYIIKGVAGEIYPCKEEIFKATYELVEE